MSHESIRDLALTVGNPSTFEADVTVVGFYEGSGLEGSAAELDGASGGMLKRAMESGDFKGELNEALLLYTLQGPAPRILLVGLGKRDELTAERIRCAAATAARRCRDIGAKKAAAALYGKGSPLPADDAAQAFAEGARARHLPVSSSTARRTERRSRYSSGSMSSCPTTRSARPRKRPSTGAASSAPP